MLPTLYQQFGEGPFLFQHDNAPVHKVRSMQKWFGMNWNTDCEPGPIVQHQETNLTNPLVAEWKKVPAEMFQHLVERVPRRVEAVIAAMFQHLVESLPRRVEAVIAATGDQLLMPMILE